MARMLGALAPYAASEETSQGRRYKESAPTHRGEYERDRDRITHSTAFRRLVYKTQVFVNHEGDLYRTRMTHSLEVAQIARTIAGALNINEPLVEAISLAHDLGHTPFGHAGQDALNACMRDFGGFEHNLQSLRVVDELEDRYPEFRGLNLTFETREGILKHCSAKNARQLGDVGKRFLERTQPSLEAQLVNLADAIAYNNHDVDDGFRAGLITIEQLREQSLFNEHCDGVQQRFPSLDNRRFIYEVIRRMIGRLVDDLVETSMTEIETHSPESIDDVRKVSHAMIHFSDAVLEQHLALKKFLRENLYRHDQVRAMNEDTQSIVESLFGCYMADLKELPKSFAAIARSGGRDIQARVVADYIAGMTDRFAIAEHERLA